MLIKTHFFFFNRATCVLKLFPQDNLKKKNHLSWQWCFICHVFILNLHKLIINWFLLNKHFQRTSAQAYLNGISCVPINVNFWKWQNVAIHIVLHIFPEWFHISKHVEIGEEDLHPRKQQIKKKCSVLFPVKLLVRTK